MDLVFDYFFLFILFLLFGVPLLVEGILIALFDKKIIPFPTRILYWIGTMFVGKRWSKKILAEKDSPKELRSYMVFALISGTGLIIFSVFYLLRVLSLLGNR